LVTEAGVREWLAVLDSAVGESQTRDLSITSLMFYNWPVEPGKGGCELDVNLLLSSVSLPSLHYLTLCVFFC